MLRAVQIHSIRVLAHPLRQLRLYRRDQLQVWEKSMWEPRHSTISSLNQHLTISQGICYKRPPEECAQTRFHLMALILRWFRTMPAHMDNLYSAVSTNLNAEANLRYKAAAARGEEACVRLGSRFPHADKGAWMKEQSQILITLAAMST